MPQELQLWPIDDLIPYERNAHTHSEEQVDQLVASMQEVGFTNPIQVTSDGGIIAGHGRLLAAKQLNLKRVPVVVLDHLTEAQRKAQVLADNKIALNAGWDLTLLALELDELSQVGFDLSLTGFSPEELAEIFDGASGSAEKPEEPEEPEEPDGPDRGVALAIVLSPEELPIWRQAKEALGYSTDKAAFMKLVTKFNNEAGE